MPARLRGADGGEKAHQPSFPRPNALTRASRSWTCSTSRFAAVDVANAHLPDVATWLMTVVRLPVTFCCTTGVVPKKPTLPSLRPRMTPSSAPLSTYSAAIGLSFHEKG